jgi:ArsR family metal-binding transcriptional regulator
MLLKKYTKEIFRPKCNPSFQSLHCWAHLEEDIRAVLPYLNTVLGGSGYTHDPPSLMLQVHGRLLTLHPKKIAINALNDETEADKILSWLKREINETWTRQKEIQPSYGVAPKPQPLEALKLLPKTNCKECSQATCLVFATLIVQGVKAPEDCTRIDDQNKKKLIEYLSRCKVAEIF